MPLGRRLELTRLVLDARVDRLNRNAKKTMLNKRRNSGCVLTTTGLEEICGYGERQGRILITKTPSKKC
jgi:hypothetical protein